MPFLRHICARPGRQGYAVAMLIAAMARVPWWANAVVGLGAVALGALLITRPLSSLSVLAIFLGLSCVATGLMDLTQTAGGRSLTRTLLGLGWVLLGILLVVWLGRTIDLLPTVLAVMLVVSGVVRWVTVGTERTWDGRVATVLFGLADVTFGVLALAWPDVTLLVVAVLFGARTIVFGLAQLAQGWGQRRAGASSTAARGSGLPPSPVSGWRRVRRTGTAAVTVLASLLALAVSGRLDAAAPVVDAFYTAPDVVAAEPGQLVRAEAFDRQVPEGARGWRILYTTTRDDGIPALASGLVVVPEGGAGPEVIAWAHGTTGFGENCAPSLLAEPFTAGAMPAMQDVLDQGWAIVATDYVGMGTQGPQPYLIGQGQARSVLDAVRAARHLPEADLGEQTVVWGHSQGGHAALWTGQVQPGYAPDVPLDGVVAMAPAADTLAITEQLPEVTGGSVFASFVAQAYSETYPEVDLDHYLHASARTLVREMSTRCLSEPGVLVSVLTVLSLGRDRPIFAVDPSTGPMGERLAQNVPTGPVPAPLLLAQGEADTLIGPGQQGRFAQRLCDSGQVLDYRTYEGLDHMGLVGEDSALLPELLDWTQDRLAGLEQDAPSCPARP